MLRYGLARVPQSLIQSGTDFCNWNCSVNLLAIDEQRRGGVDADGVPFLHGRSHRVFILTFDAGLQLGQIHIVFLTLLHGHFVQEVVARRWALLVVHIALAGVDGIGVVPIGIVVQGREAVGIDRGMDRPGMYFGRGDNPCK